MLQNPMKTLAAVLLPLAFVACERGAEPVAPTATIQASEGSSRRYVRVVFAPDSEAVQGVSAVFDDRGGDLRFGSHMLRVPPHAVLVPTTFTARQVDDGYVHVALTATITLPDGTVVDVGSQGFADELQLWLSYDKTDVVDPKALTILSLQEESLDGSTSGTGSVEVDVLGKFVRGYLDHFSQYVMASN